MPDEPKPKTSFLHISAAGEDKGCWNAMAAQKKKNLENWVTDTLNAAVPDDVRQEVRRKFQNRNQNRPGGTGNERTK